VSTQQGPPLGKEAGAEKEVLAREWSRLHPLSPLVRFARGLVGIAIVVLIDLSASQDPTSEIGDAAIVLLVLVVSVVHWWVTRWRVHGGELQIDTGLIRRQSIRVPLSRIQAVDVVRPGVARVLGLAEVRLDVAGQGQGRGRLAYLPESKAVAVRARLLALAHGLAEETPEPPAAAIWRVHNGKLAASAALGTPTTVFLILLAGLLTTVTLAPAGAPAVLSSVLPWLVISALLPARRVLAEYGFTVGEAGDGLRLRAGLVQTRAQTIPAGRVQAIRVTQRLPWRPLGWYRLEVDIARQQTGRRGSESDSALVSRALLPIGTEQDVDRLLARVLPGAVWRVPPGTGPPRRAWVKAPFAHRMLAAWHDPDHLAARTGRIRGSTVLVPQAKVQSIRYAQGPLGRATRLATVHVDTAGHGWAAEARCRDGAGAQELTEELTALARSARQRA
jgi:putative membrane protein